MFIARTSIQWLTSPRAPSPLISLWPGASGGSGLRFIIDKEGHVLTNYHVIAEAGRWKSPCTTARSSRATVVGTDRSHDLAVIQIKGRRSRPWFWETRAILQVGQKVYAIGNPLTVRHHDPWNHQLDPSVQEPDGMQIDEAIQTDCGDQSR